MSASNDITIIGGGLVGLCAALLMQHPQRRVTVLEAGQFTQSASTPLNARSIALSGSSLQIFKALGLWSEIKNLAAPIRHIHISARGRWGVTRLRAAELELEALGYVIESQQLGQCLLQAVEASDNIEICNQAAFASIEQTDKVTVAYHHQGKLHQLESSIALIADGADSQARSALGIGQQLVDYAQSAIICNLEVGEPLVDHAYERFTEQGPLAMLPLGGNRYACVYTLSPQRADILLALDDADFIEALQASFGFRLGYIERVGQRFCLPLQRSRAESLARGRCFLVGNAANALHPVAGQSFNLSLRDLASLYELLARQNLSALEPEALQTIAGGYQDLRDKEQRAVIRLGDGLVTLFSNDLPLLGSARAAALGLLDMLPPLKKQVTLAGMGLSFTGNRLLRGRL